MGFWDNLKRDIKKGIDEGLEALREGTESLKQKAEGLTTDMKKKLKIFEMKQKMQAQLTELGGRVFEAALEKKRNPFNDEKVKKVLQRLHKLNEEIMKLEGKIQPKKTARAKTRAKRARASTARSKGSRSSRKSKKATE